MNTYYLYHRKIYNTATQREKNIITTLFCIAHCNIEARTLRYKTESEYFIICLKLNREIR